MSVVVVLLPVLVKACSAQLLVSLAEPQAARISGPGGGQESPAMVAQCRKVAKVPDRTSP